MLEPLRTLHPVLLAFCGGLFTWLLTSLGAAAVFIKKDMTRRHLDGMLGFAAGVMIAASFWSLLQPAIEMSRGKDLPAWIPPLAGFSIGVLFLWGIDKILPHLHLNFPTEEAEGIKTHWRRSVLLVLAITLHNIPEGIAVGVAFGALGAGVPESAFAGAVALAVGIGIQDFPEGIAVSIPLRREGLSQWKSFWYGSLSGLVEPAGAVIGAGAVALSGHLLPYALSFAAGAMIFVTVEELIPESQRAGNNDYATIGAMLGFAVMMVLDLAFS